MCTIFRMTVFFADTGSTTMRLSRPKGPLLQTTNQTPMLPRPMHRWCGCLIVRLLCLLLPCALFVVSVSRPLCLLLLCLCVLSMFLCMCVRLFVGAWKWRERVSPLKVGTRTPGFRPRRSSGPPASRAPDRGAPKGAFGKHSIVFSVLIRVGGSRAPKYYKG